MHEGLSVVIPAYNEEHRIGSTLERIVSYLSRRGHPFEILVVDDGSTDGTSRVVEDFKALRADFGLRVLHNPANRGKGFSVRRGMLEAVHGYALLTDADLSAPIEEVAKLEREVIEGSCDIAFGSRDLPGSDIQIHQPWLRENGGKLFNWAVRRLLGIPFRDTQCGFKLFRMSSCRLLFERQRITGFSYDVEILCLAWNSRLALREIPIVWNHDAGSKVSFFRDGLRMMIDVLRIRWSHQRLPGRPGAGRSS